MDYDNHVDNSHDSGLFQHSSGTRSLHLLREVLLTYRQMLKELSRETGLSAAQFEVLRELARAEGRRTVSGLARDLEVDPAAVSRVIAGLQRVDLVTRVTDERDRRSQPIVLTETGRSLMVAFHAEAHAHESDLLAGLDPQALETTMQVLGALRDNLETHARRRRRNETGLRGLE